MKAMRVHELGAPDIFYVSPGQNQRERLSSPNVDNAII